MGSQIQTDLFAFRIERNEIAARLLDYGFANYSLFCAEGRTLDELRVVGGVEDTCKIAIENFNAVVGKGEENKISSEIEINEKLIAPVKISDTVGRVIYKNGEKIIGEAKITATETVEKINYGDILARFFAKILIK